jgi:hypothetical protein
MSIYNVKTPIRIDVCLDIDMAVTLAHPHIYTILEDACRIIRFLLCVAVLVLIRVLRSELHLSMLGGGRQYQG